MDPNSSPDSVYQQILLANTDSAMGDVLAAAAAAFPVQEQFTPTPSTSTFPTMTPLKSSDPADIASFLDEMETHLKPTRLDCLEEDYIRFVAFKKSVVSDASPEAKAQYRKTRSELFAFAESIFGKEKQIEFILDSCFYGGERKFGTTSPENYKLFSTHHLL